MVLFQSNNRAMVVQYVHFISDLSAIADQNIQKSCTCNLIKFCTSNVMTKYFAIYCKNTFLMQAVRCRSKLERNNLVTWLWISTSKIRHFAKKSTFSTKLHFCNMGSIPGNLHQECTAKAYRSIIQWGWWDSDNPVSTFQPKTKEPQNDIFRG